MQMQHQSLTTYLEKPVGMDQEMPSHERHDDGGDSGVALLPVQLAQPSMKSCSQPLVKTLGLARQNAKKTFLSERGAWKLAMQLHQASSSKAETCSLLSSLVRKSTSHAVKIKRTKKGGLFTEGLVNLAHRKLVTKGDRWHGRSFCCWRL